MCSCILDTRTNLGLAGRFADATPRDLQVAGSVPVASGGFKTVVPTDAIGVLVNVTVVTPTHEGFLSLRPQGATGEPTTSTVNFFPGAIEPNAATVDLNNGEIQIWVETASDSGSADVLIDVVGYTVGHTHDDRYYTESESDDRFYRQTEVDAIVTELEQAQPFAVSDFTTEPFSDQLDDFATVVASVEVTAPVAGQVTVNSSANVSASATTVGCFIRNDGVAQMYQFFQRNGAPTPNGNVAGTAQYDIAAGTTETYELACYSPNDDGGAIVEGSGLTAIFTPAR